MIELPVPLLREVDALVADGVFATREEAVAALVRIGLDSFRSRGSRPPPRPPVPPGHREPDDDRPISVDPSDLKWIDRS